MGYTESGQSRANEETPRFACNPDLNHAQSALGSVKNLGHYAASWSAWWPKRPSSTAALT